MFISIGVDCGMADFLKKNNLRKFSCPFDWVVSYDGISECIDDNFKNFIPKNNTKTNSYGICLLHYEFITEEDITYTRRINRLIDFLENTEEEVIFCRKGHAYHNHSEHNCINDIDIAEKLDLVLRKKYPNLKYKIIVILVCGVCFDSNKEYTSSVSEKINIYNIATPEVDNTKFENFAHNLFILNNGNYSSLTSS